MLICSCSSFTELLYGDAFVDLRALCPFRLPSPPTQIFWLPLDVEWSHHLCYFPLWWVTFLFWILYGYICSRVYRHPSTYFFGLVDTLSGFEWEFTIMCILMSFNGMYIYCWFLQTEQWNNVLPVLLQEQNLFLFSLVIIFSSTFGINWKHFCISNKMLTVTTMFLLF